ncbi:MAG TPA: hypothetical protein VN719_09415 [Gemmatimonadales bacterium]|nr:hypothetical protein [Gemmatimonadales bacterium]
MTRYRTAKLIVGDVLFWVVCVAIVLAVCAIGREPWRGFTERLPELSSDG